MTVAVGLFKPVFCACGRQFVSSRQHASGMCEYCETTARGLCACGAVLESAEEKRDGMCVSCIRRALVAR